MITFLPSPDFEECAAVLDVPDMSTGKRWGRKAKQCVEVAQILNALADSSYGWQHHPCTVMWRCHSYQLAFRECR